MHFGFKSYDVCSPETPSLEDSTQCNRRNATISFLKPVSHWLIIKESLVQENEFFLIDFPNDCEK